MMGMLSLELCCVSEGRAPEFSLDLEANYTHLKKGKNPYKAKPKCFGENRLALFLQYFN